MVANAIWNKTSLREYQRKQDEILEGLKGVYTTIFLFWGTVKPAKKLSKITTRTWRIYQNDVRKESQTQQEKSEISND